MLNSEHGLAARPPATAPGTQNDYGAIAASAEHEMVQQGADPGGSGYLTALLDALADAGHDMERARADLAFLSSQLEAHAAFERGIKVHTASLDAAMRFAGEA